MLLALSGRPFSFSASIFLSSLLPLGQALLAKAGSDALLQLVLGLLFFRLNKLDDAFKALANCPSLEAYEICFLPFLPLNLMSVLM